MQVIPLSTSPSQSLTLQLTVDGKPLILNIVIKYNEMAQYWILTIKDAANNLLVDSVPVLTGNYPAANILGQQQYLGIGSWYIVNVSNLKLEVGSETGYGQGFFGSGPYGGSLAESGFDYPDDNNLGTDFQLWIGDTFAAA